MKSLAILVPLLLVACGDDRPPAPTTEQSEQLNEVEVLLNEQAKEEGPAPQGTDPESSNSAGPSRE